MVNINIMLITYPTEHYKILIIQYIKVGRNVCWNKSNTMLVSQTQYPAGQPRKKRRHCTPLITKISLSSALIQMQGNHLSR